VLQPGPAASHRIGDEVAHDDATLAPHLSIVAKADMPGDISNDQTSESAVSYEDVRTKPKDEKRDTGASCCANRVCQIVSRYGIVEQVGRTPDAKGGVWREWLIPLESRRVELATEFLHRAGELSERHGSRKKFAARRRGQVETASSADHFGAVPATS
jgi:hypothetical protein